MGKQENYVMAAVQQCAETYSIPCFRLQSRVLMVKGSGSGSGSGNGNRPMFFGRWKDALGVEHSRGMADFILHPRIQVARLLHSTEMAFIAPTAVPLWCECKFGETKINLKQEAKCICRMSIDHQEHFRKYVTSRGAFHIVCRDSADALVSWLRGSGAIL